MIFEQNTWNTYQYTFVFCQKKPKKVKEESFEVLDNMSRVLSQQAKVVAFDAESRYVPVKKVKHTREVILIDSRQITRKPTSSPSIGHLWRNHDYE